MKSNDSLVKLWFKKADVDLLSIENNLNSNNIPTESVCFHAQQCVEKYLKGFLIHYNVEFKKVHDLSILLNQCVEIDENFNIFKNILPDLTVYAVEIRYPDDWYEPTIEDAKKAYNIAVKVKNFVLKKVNK